MGPVDFLRDRFDRARTHPFQALAGGAMGMMFPGAGMLAGRGFDLYNNHQFNQSADQSYQHGADQGNQAQSDAMNRPLAGPLGLVDGMPGYVGGGDFSGGGGSDNGPLAQALGGGGQQGPGMGYNPGLNYGNNYGQGQTQYSPLSSLLDFLGPNPNQNGLQGDHRSHQEIMDDLQNQQNIGSPALYGVSPGMVNGGMVINGMRPAGYDPNQGAMAHHFFGG